MRRYTGEPVNPDPDFETAQGTHAADVRSPLHPLGVAGGVSQPPDRLAPGRAALSRRARVLDAIPGALPRRRRRDDRLDSTARADPFRQSREAVHAVRSRGRLHAVWRLE